MTGKAYALISEYALMCDMRLITREYGIIVTLLWIIIILTFHYSTTTLPYHACTGCKLSDKRQLL